MYDATSKASPVNVYISNWVYLLVSGIIKNDVDTVLALTLLRICPETPWIMENRGKG